MKELFRIIFGFGKDIEIFFFSRFILTPIYSRSQAFPIQKPFNQLFLFHMKHFFILGKNNALAIAELNSVIALKNPELLAPDFLIADLESEINPSNLIKTLGGTIKIGVIRKKISRQKATSELINSLIEITSDKKAISDPGKFNFGFSAYGEEYFNKKDIGIKIKNNFNARKISSRFVVSREKTLSSVVITQNKLIKRGIELVGIKKDQQIFIGETLAVQPFKDLSRRDFGRPARDDFSGMLPPKLAMMMINIAGPKTNESVILDPFCGSGTVVNEAALLGYKQIQASDISKKAVDNTYTNFSWLKELYELDNVHLKLNLRNVLVLSKFIKSNSVDCLVTEPYLGPQRGRIDFALVIKELEDLYSKAFVEFNKILKKGSRVVMIWPNFYGQKPINPNYDGFLIKNVLPDEIKKSPLLKKSTRGNLVYSRAGQKVFREVLVLEKE